MIDALPPPYTPFALPAGGDAFVRACALAAEAGAGTLVWVRRPDVVDCAVVLEPEQTLAVARQVAFAGLNAAADALAVDCPPEKPLAFAWPDALFYDNGLVGGVRLGWPAACAEDQVPDWLVLGLALRVLADGPAGVAPPAALGDEGFPDFDTGAFVASYARHLMVALDEWGARGPEAVRARWRQRWDGAGPADLAALQAAPTWRDAATGEIRR
jgi:biotin-(acetyl-CoA carboxylase) ligase